MRLDLSPTSNAEVQRFTTTLQSWLKKTWGDLGQSIGEKVSVTKAERAPFVKISLTNLRENRSLDVKQTPSSRGTLPLAPQTAYGTYPLWEKPTPEAFLKHFSEDFAAFSISGTQHYKPCPSCKEQGKTECPTCKTAGTVTCGTCKGRTTIDCPNCAGYGVRKCLECTQGTVFMTCTTSGCRDGRIRCHVCEGSGYRNVGSNSVPCGSCQRGSNPCLTCRGTGEVSRPCSYCHDGLIPCGVCRTQKRVDCPTCDCKGTVTCETCSGGQFLPCTPCKTKGGFHVEELLQLRSVFSVHETSLNPLAIPASFPMILSPALVQVTHAAQKESLRQFAVDDLTSPFQQLSQKADQEGLDHLLSRQLKVEQAQVMRVSFRFNSTEGTAFVDLNGFAFQLSQNPFQSYVDSIKKNLTDGFNAALSRQDFTEAKKVLENARKFNLPVSFEDWEKKIEDAILKDRSKRQAKDLSTRVLPLLVAIAVVSWLAAGFFAQVGFAALLAFAGLARLSYLKLKALPPDLYRAQKRSTVTTLIVSIAVIVAVLIGVTVYTATAGINQQITNGKILSENEQ